MTKRMYSRQAQVDACRGGTLIRGVGPFVEP